MELAPVLLRTVTFCSPEMTVSSSPSLLTTVVRTSGLPLTNEWSCSAPSDVTMRSQKYSSTSWRAPVTHAYLSTKLRAIRRAKSSIAPTPPRRASAYTVFFCVSVAMMALLSPVAWVSAVKSPINWLVTFTSLILCTGVDRSMCTRRTSALPY